MGHQSRNGTTARRRQVAEVWLLSDTESGFVDLVKNITTTRPLGLREILEDLRVLSGADAVMLLSRAVWRSRTPWWTRHAASCRSGLDRVATRLVEGKSGRALLNRLVMEARGHTTVAPHVEFAPSWCSATLADGTAAEQQALRALAQVEEEGDDGIGGLKSEMPGLRLAMAFPLGHLILGDWRLGDTVLLMLRVSARPGQRTAFFAQREECVIALMVYLAEVNSHLLRKHSVEGRPVRERREHLADLTCARAYLRSICRLAPLWREFPRVGFEDRQGITTECLAYIRRTHREFETGIPSRFDLREAVNAVSGVVGRQS
jgi:hypothetical protein